MCSSLAKTNERESLTVKRRRKGALSFARTTDVVLDEVDVLALSDGGAMLRPLFGADGDLAQTARFVFVTATLPKVVEKQLQVFF